MCPFWLKVYINEFGGRGTVSLVIGVNSLLFRFLMLAATCSSVTAKWSY